MLASNLFARAAVAATAVTAASAQGTRPNVGGQKVILDNDWSTNGFIPYLLALDHGWDVIGLAADTANSWALQHSLHALATLEIGNLSCIPVAKGADYPLLNTPKLMATWQQIWGELPWQGVFRPENTTVEGESTDPTSGDPQRIVHSAFVEGYPNTTVASNRSAEWMIQQVRKYPGEVLIWSGGALTNIAMAVRMDPEFASLAKGLVIMGGYIDVNLLMTSGNVLQADYQSDINFKTDPEATKIVLTSNFRNITLVSNAANAWFPDKQFLDELIQVPTPYSMLYNATAQLFLPWWDETAMFAVLDESHVLNRTSFYVSVDTSYHSPTYGNIYGHHPDLLPKAQDLRMVDFVYSTNGTKLRERMLRSMQYPKSCT